MAQKETVRNYFDKLSLDYQKAYECDKEDPIRTHIFNERKKIVLGLIDKNGGRLLDIGCGPGPMTKDLLNKNFTVYNSDISPIMIKRAKKSLNGNKYKDRVFFKVCDTEHLDFENSYFDVVLCVGVLEYLEDYRKTLDVISKVLKKDGIAIITVPNRCSILNKIDGLLTGLAFKVIPNIFNKDKSLKRHGIFSRTFVPWKFAHELEKCGLSKVFTKFHGYRLAFLKRFFPKFWIFLNDILNKINLPIMSHFFAVNCVIKFKKNAND